MKIIFLGKKDNKVYDFLSSNEDVYAFEPEKEIAIEEVKEISPDLIISYGYKKIIKDDIVEKFKNKIINLHISYLPWNRGAYPNIWSFLDNTPKGVTIHYIDSGIDTGDILFQKSIFFENINQETFESTYNRCSREIENLFIENWTNIKNSNFQPVKQDKKEGTFHTIKQSNKVFKDIGLHQNWNEKITRFLKERRTDDKIIDDIQNIRKQNNTHWMDVVRLAFRESPKEARNIFKKIKFCDYKVNELLKELSENE